MFGIIFSELSELRRVNANHRLYRLYAAFLSENLQDALFSHGISFSKDGLLLHFVKGKERLCYEVKFVEGELLITNAQWTDPKARLKSNAVVQFKELEGRKISDVIYGLFDRVFAFVFDDGSRLLFKSFGKFSNVLWYESKMDLPAHIFRFNFKKDWELRFDGISTLWISAQVQNLKLPVFEDEAHWTRTFQGIKTRELLEEFPEFFEKNPAKQNSAIERLSNPMNYQPELVIKGESAILNWHLRDPSPLHVRIEELEKEIRIYLRWYFFEREKTVLLSHAAKQIKSLQQRIGTYSKRKESLLSERNYKEMGDLILGNAHSLRKGISEALITDFFTNQRIRIKLNPNLSAAENAEKWYKKSKNQNLEIGNLDEQISKLEDQLKLWKDIDLHVGQAEHPRDLKPYREYAPALKNNTVKSIENAVPYKRLDYKGFEIWLGKNAKSNDALLRSAHKNDLWMHAADVTGSHVIIRNMGKPVPKNVLESVAAFCAFHSKGKSQTLQTVMFTERKMVSKAKNGAPGEVKVSKFSTMDVEPKNF